LTLRKGKIWISFSPSLRFLLTVSIVTYFSCTLTIYIGQPHYIAHLAPVFYAIMLLMMRALYDEGKPSGRFLVRSVPLICCVLLLSRIAAPAFHFTPKPSWTRTWCSQDEQNLERARISKQLKNLPGDHLAIVRYRPSHDFILDEWVYNDADIDRSRVIWARDMGAQNSELIQYFSARQVWLVEPDYNPARVSPYVQ
jgi:hypothetical protein